MSAWTVQQLVDQANKNTENRASSKYDLAMEFWLALDDFCRSKHYWWRRKYFSLETVVGQQNYDLSVPDATISSAGFPDLDEIEDIYSNIGAAAGQAVSPGACPLKPMVSSLEIIGAKNTTTNAPPAGYFIDPSVGLQSLVLNAPADQVAKLMGTYWAMPMVTDTGTDAVPLVPMGLHWGLVAELTARIYSLLLSQEDPRYQMAVAERARFREQAALFKSWTSKQAVEARSNARAVRSHG